MNFNEFLGLVMLFSTSEMPCRNSSAAASGITARSGQITGCQTPEVDFSLIDSE